MKSYLYVYVHVHCIQIYTRCYLWDDHWKHVNTLFQDAKMTLNFCTETVLNINRLVFKRLFLSLLFPKFTKTKRYLEFYYKMPPDECQVIQSFKAGVLFSLLLDVLLGFVIFFSQKEKGKSALLICCIR